MILVDTYNVLHTQGVLPPYLAGLDLSGLAALIASSRYSDRPVRLICDGSRASAEGPRAHSKGGIQAVYAGPGADADSLIERLIEESSAPRGILVVSSDRRLHRAAKRRRAVSLASDKFLAQLLVDQSRPRPTPLPEFTRQIPLDRHSVAYWMEKFGYDSPSDLARLAGAKPKGPAPKAASPAPPKPSTSQKKPDQPAPGLPAGEQIDPILLDALEEWAGELSLDDLDMRKWLNE